MSKFFKLYLLLFSYCFFAVAQEEKNDSLIRVLKRVNNDTLKLQVLNALVENVADENVWPKYNEQMLELSVQLLDHKNKAIQLSAKKYYAFALNNKGYILNIKGELLKSEEYYLQSLAVMKEISNQTGIAGAYNNLGYIYKSQGNLKQALDYYHKSLKIYEELKDLHGTANTINNIAVIYNKQGDNEKALLYNMRSLSINRKLGEKYSIATSLNNIGLIYLKQHKVKEAYESMYQALELQNEMHDSAGIANTYLNIGVANESQKKYDEALKNYSKSLVIFTAVHDLQGQTNINMNIGSLHYKLGDYNKAIQYGEKSYKLAKEINYAEELYDAAEFLSRVYDKKGKYKEAYNMHKLYISLRDSVLNEQSKKAMLQKFYQYSYDKKAAADSVRNLEEKKLKDAQIEVQKIALKQEKTKQYALYSGLLIFIIFSVVVYNRFRITKKQKQIIELQKQKVDESNEELLQQNEEIAAQRDEIEHQKDLVDDQRKEIIDSIKYAKRLQEAILPHDSFIQSVLPEHFVFFKPKDIVSGDFYWMDKINNKRYFAAVDCTGHGVPGAFLSIVGFNLLKHAIHEHGKTTPAEILDQVNRDLSDSLKQTLNESTVKDGMDIALCSYDDTTGILEYAGANNCIYLLRPITANPGPFDFEFREYKANKHPIGIFLGEDLKPFSNNIIHVNKGDIVYLFTDGFADQFGGLRNKKFKYKQFEDLLMSVAFKEMKDQKVILNNVIQNWAGLNEQVDDILVIGVRL